MAVSDKAGKEHVMAASLLLPVFVNLEQKQTGVSGLDTSARLAICLAQRMRTSMLISLIVIHSPIYFFACIFVIRGRAH